MASQTRPGGGEPVNPAGEVGGDLSRCAGSGTGSGEFDGQRQTGDLPTDLKHGDKVSSG